MSTLFTSPDLLILAPAYAGFVWFFFRPAGRSQRFRFKTVRAVIFNALGALCLVLAAAGMQISAPAKQIQVVVAADVSDSVFDLETQTSKLNELLKPLDREHTQIAMTVFGGNSGTERSMGPLPDSTPSPGGFPRDRTAAKGSLLPNLNRVTTVVERGATDIGHAIDFSRGAFPVTSENSVQARGLLILSDFRDTRGRAELAAATLYGSGVDLLATPALLGPSADVRVAGVRVPEESRMGRAVPIEVTLAGSSPVAVQVSVWRQRLGQEAVPVGSQKVTLSQDADDQGAEIRRTVRILDTPDSPGVAVYTARISATENGVIPNDIAVNNQLSAALRVTGPSRWAVLTHRGSTLARLCSAPANPLGVETVLFTTGMYPRRAAEYKPFVGILVDGLPFSELKGSSLDALNEAAESGKAVVALGGERAFGAGGHLNEGLLERILPVEMTPDDDRTRSILFLIDVSKSMDDRIGGGGSGVKKIDFASEQMAQAVQKLKPLDKIGMIVFSGTAQVAAPISSDASRAGFLHAIKEIRTEANTDLLAALKQARKTLESDTSEEQIVVLLSDGEETAPIPRDEIVKGAIELCPQGSGPKRRRTTLYTFGIGTGTQDFNAAGEALMRDLAEAGGGEYSPDFLKLAERLERTFESAEKDFFTRKESFAVQAESYEHPLLSSASAGTSGAWPILGFRNRVKAKPGGEVLLWSGPVNEDARARRPDPLLILSGPQSQSTSRRAAVALPAEEVSGGSWLSSERGRKTLLSLLAWAEAKQDAVSAGWTVTAESKEGDWLQIDARGREAGSAAPANGRKIEATLTPLFLNSVPEIAQNRGPDKFPLQAEAPGLYRARIRLPAQGIYRLAIREAARPLHEQLISVPYAAEYQRFGTDRLAMQSLAAKAGGDSRVIENAGDLAAWLAAKREAQGSYSLRPWLLAAGLALFMLEFALRGSSVKR